MRRFKFFRSPTLLALRFLLGKEELPSRESPFRQNGPTVFCSLKREACSGCVSYVRSSAESKIERLRGKMIWIQRSLRLPRMARGCHLVTSQVLQAIPERSQIAVGMLQVFIKHTSASLTVNENADPDVRVDLEMALTHLAPEDLDYVHTLEGPDDMPAHVKSSLMGSSILVPLANGQPCFGTWQGIYLCEHRNHAEPRHLVITAFGMPSGGESR